jgi:hypothetical protein
LPPEKPPKEPAVLSLIDSHSPHTRRDFLCIGTLGLGGLSLPQLAKRANQLTVVRSYVPGRDISNHVICPIVHRKETLGASLGTLYSRLAGMNDPVNEMLTHAALFPPSVAKLITESEPIRRLIP